ncbi:GPI-anchor biosynthetic protein [Sesbania bispinosa]|nr:GPI-anchor biosynthetic protein [Sesbania bispinosa]
MPLETNNPDPKLQKVAALANALDEEEARKAKELEEHRGGKAGQPAPPLAR